MKTKLVLLALVSAFSLQPSALLAQGSLTPPGAPAPTMKTLDQVRPGIPLPSSVATLNITNPGCYYLVTNLTVTGDFSISTNNVSIDLNAFTLRCTAPNAALQVSSSGGPYTNIVVCNGTIANSGYGGVLAQNSERLICENLLITDCTANNSAIIGGQRSAISHCALYNVKDGISVGNESVVEDCIVVNSAQAGIAVGTNSIVRRCLVTRCAWSGIRIANGGLLADNVVAACGFSNYSGAIRLSSSGTRVEGNQLNGNYAWLETYGATNLIFRNTSVGSGAASLSGTQVIGPVINTSGTVTNNNPWANFVF